MSAIFVLLSQNPLRSEVRFFSSSLNLVSLARQMVEGEHDLAEGAVLVLARFTGDRAAAIHSCLDRMEETKGTEDFEIEKFELEALLAGLLFPSSEYEPDEHDDPMDGDHESALASAGMGTDEDYGRFDDGGFDD